MAQIRKWLENHGEDFWEWLVTPPASDGKEMEARELALTTISEILNMDMGVDAEGKPRLDLNIIKLKLDAAKLLVGNKGPMIAIQNNVNEDEERLPRGLRGKSSTQIEARINQITRHIPKESDQFSLEGEIAN
jgi:hypothetical protein